MVFSVVRGLGLAGPPGVSIPDFPLGTSLTVVAVSHHDVLYAENISPTPADTLG